MPRVDLGAIGSATLEFADSLDDALHKATTDLGIPFVTTREKIRREGMFEANPPK